MTRPYAEVIGDPIAQSKSPIIHNFWLEKLGIDAEYRRCHIRADELAGYFARRRGDAEWLGCNVTMPHKLAVMGLLDHVEVEAARIGAVNTIVRNQASVLGGYNTDAAGFFEPLAGLVGDQPYVFAYVIGTGGAARAIVDRLYHEQFLIFSLSRDPAIAIERLGGYLGKDPDFALALAKTQKGEPLPADPEVFSLIVNATPLGMNGQPPLDLGWAGFRKNAVAYDIVTAPPETAFLETARHFGMTTIDGLAMLIGQAAIAFEKFFGQPAPREHDAELRALLIA